MLSSFAVDSAGAKLAGLNWRPAWAGEVLAGRALSAGNARRPPLLCSFFTGDCTPASAWLCHQFYFFVLFCFLASWFVSLNLPLPLWLVFLFSSLSSIARVFRSSQRVFRSAAPSLVWPSFILFPLCTCKYFVPRHDRSPNRFFFPLCLFPRPFLCYSSFLFHWFRSMLFFS